MLHWQLKFSIYQKKTEIDILSLNIDKGWRKKAVREIADTDKPVKVLDVACGTADFTIEIAQKVAPGSKVTGVDISEGMMAIGREKIRKAGVSAELSAVFYQINQLCICNDAAYYDSNNRHALQGVISLTYPLSRPTPIS